MTKEDFQKILADYVAEKVETEMYVLKKELAAALAERDAAQADSERLQWMIDKPMVWAHIVEWKIGGNFTTIQAGNAVNVTGIETRDVRAAIDAARGAT